MGRADLPGASERQYSLDAFLETGVHQMSDETRPADQPYTPGEWIRGVLFVVLATAAAIALGIWLLATFVFRCGCTMPA